MDHVIACGASFSDLTGILEDKPAVEVDIGPPVAAVWGDCAIPSP
ncbi:MAG: hypothetical protein WBJ06_03040 [Candidatus Methanoculleus thermohydrogenotrophicum]